MHRLVCHFACMIFLLIPAAPPAVSQEAQRITFGIFPYVSPVQLVEFHNPLRKYLEEVLNTPVSLVTAPDFMTFVARTRAETYDIILTAPHLGRLAEVQSGYQRIARTLHTVQGIYLVRKDSAIHSLSDLQGKTITLVGRAAIITQMVEHQLKGLGLEDGKNITFRLTRTHNNAMYAPLRGESDASVTGILLFDKIGEQDRENVRIIGKTPVAPGFMLMAARQFDAERITALKQAVFNFGTTRAGQTYLAVTGFERLAPIDNVQMEALDPYIQYFLHDKGFNAPAD